jgi:hypothetical protein
MGSFGSFYKGEKKKKKKGESANFGFAPVFTPPDVIAKAKKEK